MRRLPFFLLLAVVGCALSPFLLTAWLRELRGLNIKGTVTRKQEIVWHSAFANSITRSLSITVSYFPPGQSWSAYKSVNLPLKRYDEINRGDVVEMRYLLEKDLPNYPLLHSLYRSGFLPVASVDGRSVFTVWQDLSHELPVREIGGAAVLFLVLWLWYKSRIPGGGYALVFCFLLAVAAMSLAEFPRPMPKLQGDLLAGKATVQNEWIADKIFGGRGSSRPLSLEQPVQYVPFAFVPENRREPVVAVDNIDAGSIPGLKVGQMFDIQYERADPRNARLVAGTRSFWNRNLRGLVMAGVIWVVIGSLAMALWAGVSRWIKHVTALSSSKRKAAG